MESDHIDELLERYLLLVHEYTALREQLSAHQTSVYSNIARANFHAERGMRFGQDHYDERMQAIRRVAITTGNDQDDVPVFTVINGDAESSPPQESTDPDKKSDIENVKDEGEGEGAVDEKKKTDNPSRMKPKDPLRWFGMLTPMPLRQAQTQSIRAVEDIIPKLVSVNAQMAQVEIEVRRARKKRAKAEAATKKEREFAVGTEVMA
ncbi:hypothetical protein M426DRAFT_325570 [Hypoxylon sp. CI-4A]|nr:hypothetical protein M426DRAFT_325570 [Hypoxylon sp. CI-4A]